MEQRSSPRHFNILCFWLVALLLPMAFVRVCYTFLYPLEARIAAPRAFAGSVQPNPSDPVGGAADLRQTEIVQNGSQRDTEGGGGGGGGEVRAQGVDPVAGDPSGSKATEECGLSHDAGEGEWVVDTSSPRYTNDTCAFVPTEQNCLVNGKFADYLYWRWQPQKCELPFLNAAAFLKKMDGRVLAFVGDSIARNQWHSLHCLLHQVHKDSYIFRHSDNWKTAWVKFPSANFTLVVMWAPYLLDYSLQPNNEAIHLHLDVLQESLTSVLPQFDVAVFSTGQWYFKRAVFYVGNRFIGTNSPTEGVPYLEVAEVYRIALKTIFAGIPGISGYRGLSLWRTWAVEHFEGGTWDTGGSCTRRVPYTSNNSGFQESYHRHFLDLQLQEFNEAGLHQSPLWDLLSVTSLSWLRPDAHPGPYRIPQPFRNGRTEKVQRDCLHWCMPGPVDSWNDWLVHKISYHSGRPVQ